MGGERALKLGEPVRPEGHEQVRQGRLAPQRPEHDPGRCSPALDRIADGAADNLMAVMRIVRRGTGDELGPGSVGERDDGTRQPGLGQREIVIGAERRSRVGDHELEAGHATGLDELPATPFAISRPPETAGQGDDAPTRIAEGHERRPGSQDLVVGVRRDADDDPCRGHQRPSGRGEAICQARASGEDAVRSMAGSTVE